MAKNVLIRARVTKKEREEIHAIAKMRDTTVSEMIRSLAHVQPIQVLTFPIIFLFKRSPNFPLSQSPILSLSIIIKSSLLATAKSLKPLFCRRFQT